MENAQARFWDKYYKYLIGKTIKDAGMKERNGELIPFIVVDEAGECWIVSDEEGNGPGWIENLPYPGVGSEEKKT